MIDLNDALESTRRARAAITMLRSALAVLENSSIVQEAAPRDITLGMPVTGAGIPPGAVITSAASPPPPPATIADVVSDNDPEVEFDTDGNVKSVTTAVELPPPPVAVPAPPAAIPAPPGPAVPAELDIRGMPWDARIHASNRAKKIDGSWKNKRGIDPNLVTACEAQNKPGNAPTTNAPAVPAATVPTAPAITAAAPAPTPPPPPPPSVGVAAPAAAVPSAIDFRGLMQKIQAATATGKLSADQVNAALAGVGLKPEEMAQLINNAPLIASVNAAVDKCIS